MHRITLHWHIPENLKIFKISSQIYDMLVFVSLTFPVLTWLWNLNSRSPIVFPELNNKDNAGNTTVLLKKQDLSLYKKCYKIWLMVVIIRCRYIKGWWLNIYNSHSCIGDLCHVIIIYYNYVIVLKCHKMQL